MVRCTKEGKCIYKEMLTNISCFHDQKGCWKKFYACIGKHGVCDKAVPVCSSVEECENVGILRT